MIYYRHLRLRRYTERVFRRGIREKRQREPAKKMTETSFNLREFVLFYSFCVFRPETVKETSSAIRIRFSLKYFSFIYNLANPSE
mmetsp:Transcript_7876/g.29463  ORF Transcript_7876/g.29463 Transcript_7876/m.29463 type:complete len:85 (-) Transcript_7876:1399-1653(-)